MIFGSKHKETAKLGPQRIMVKSSEVGQPPLLAESSILTSGYSLPQIKSGYICFGHKGEFSFVAF